MLFSFKQKWWISYESISLEFSNNNATRVTETSDLFINTNNKFKLNLPKSIFF